MPAPIWGKRTNGRAEIPERKSILEDLKKFANTKDRYLTGFFAGRKAETDRITAWIEDVQDRQGRGASKPAAGATMLIQGAPGAGKTSLIDKLQQDWSEEKEREPAAIAIQVDSLSSSRALEAALRRDERLFSVSALGRLVSVFKGFSILGVDVSIGDPGQDDLDDAGVRRIKCPIVLFIDEIQNAPQTGFTQGILRKLHEGDQTAPIIPVYAGLAHSRDVLSRAGISRLSRGAVINLGSLSEEETRESVDKFMQAHGVRTESKTEEYWKKLIWRESCGWPQHLHNMLQAVAEELILEPNGDLAKIDPIAARLRSSAWRADYYSSCARDGLEKPDMLLGRIMEAIGVRGAKKSRCIALIRSLNRPGDESCSIPEGMNVPGFFNLMIAKGLLQESADEAGVYRTPIPLMQNWCAAAAGGRLYSAAMKGAVEVIRGCLKAGEEIGARDARGRTPLHIAAEEDWPEIAETLLEAGADINARDSRGLTPAEVVDPESNTARLLRWRKPSPKTKDQDVSEDRGLGF